MLARAAAVLRVAPRGAALVRPFASAADVAMAVDLDAPDFKKFASPVPQTFDHTEGLAGPATKVRILANGRMPAMRPYGEPGRPQRLGRSPAQTPAASGCSAPRRGAPHAMRR
jgi:hypothetical protein